MKIGDDIQCLSSGVVSQGILTAHPKDSEALICDMET